MDELLKLINNLLLNPLGAILVVLVLLAFAIVLDQQRKLKDTQNEGETEKADSQITLELIRNNDKFHSKVDRLTDSQNALTAAINDQTAVTKAMVGQEARRIAMREDALRNEHADRERLFETQALLGKEMNASVQAINALALTLSDSIPRAFSAEMSKVASETREVISLKLQTGLTSLGDTVKTEVGRISEDLKPFMSDQQQILQQLKAIETQITNIANQQTKDSEQLRTELKAVADQVADTARRLDNATKPPAGT